MDREGKVLASRIERSSGFRPLDDEAASLPKPAQPLMTMYISRFRDAGAA